jgi:hypothetical protein
MLTTGECMADMPHCRSLRRGSQRHRAEHALVNLSQRPAWIQDCCTAKADFSVIHYECLLRCHSPRWSLKADIQACTQKHTILEALSTRLPVLAGMLCSKAELCLCQAHEIKCLEVQLLDAAVRSDNSETVRLLGREEAHLVLAILHTSG